MERKKVRRWKGRKKIGRKKKIERNNKDREKVKRQKERKKIGRK